MGSIVYFFLGLGVSLVGAYIIASSIFRKIWKEKVTHPKLIGYTITYLVSFSAIMFVIGWIVEKNEPFTR